MTLSDLNSLDINEVGFWPLPAKIGLLVLIAALIAGLGYWFDLSSMIDQLNASRRQEASLKQEFRKKQSVVANSAEYKARLDKLRSLLADLVKQLPTGTEMPDLLEKISELGRSNGLVFQVFRPQNEKRQKYFAIVPISIQAQGTYHQFGEFISSISAMQRIVTLQNAVLKVPSGRSPTDVNASHDLDIEATLQTYRYLEPGEERAR